MSLACSAKFITPMLNSPIDLNTISKMHPNLFNKRQDHFNILCERYAYIVNVNFSRAGANCAHLRSLSSSSHIRPTWPMLIIVVGCGVESFVE